MDFLKKYKHCFVGSGTIIAFICIFICFGQGVAGKYVLPDLSLYQLTFGDFSVGGIVVAWIFLVLGILSGGAATALLCLKKNIRIAGYIGSAAAILFLVSGILYYSVLGFTGTISYEFGVASGFNGSLLLIAFVATLAGSVGAIFDK